MTGAELHEKFAQLQYQSRLAYAELDWDTLVTATEQLSEVAQELRETEKEPEN